MKRVFDHSHECTDSRFRMRTRRIIGMICASQLAVGATLFAASPALGWGSLGHETLCAIAWQETTDAGRTLVKQVLKTPDASSFGIACTWPDEVRNDPNYKWAKPQHFVNVPRGQALDARKDCPDEGCAMRGIGQQARVVADVDAPPQLRAEALKFLAHFLGDLHQPLHVSYAEDAGGNGIGVAFCPTAQCWTSIDNLHQVWDSGILATKTHDPSKLAAELQPAITDAMRTLWKSGDVVAWAGESYDLATNDAYRPLKKGKIKSGYLGALPQPIHLGKDYAPLMRPLLLTQLQKAGVRLAMALDGLAHGSVPPSLAAVAPRFVEPARPVPSSLTVRESASTTSAPLGTIAVGQRAELIGRVSTKSPGTSQSWYRVRLGNRKEGYVRTKDVRVVPA